MYLSGFSQDTKELCNMTYSIELKSGDEFVSLRDLYATFSWNFNESQFQTDKVKIEIVPILDCWNGVQGTKFRDAFSLPIENARGEVKVMHIKMMAKCFKWRLVVKSDTCNDATEWNYFSYIN